MIETFETETKPLSNEETMISEFLRYFLEARREGKEYAIKTDSLIIEVRNEFGKTEPESRLRKMLNRLRTNGELPCLASGGTGYYVAKREEEMDETLRSLRDRLKSQIHTINCLEKQKRDKFGYDNETVRDINDLMDSLPDDAPLAEDGCRELF